MRVKPTRKALEKVAGRRPKQALNTTSAVIRHALESESTLLKRGLASDFGRIKQDVEKRPPTQLVRPVRSKPLPVSAPASSSEGIVPFGGAGNQLALSEPEFSGPGQRLPRRARGQALMERGLAQQAKIDARLAARRGR